MAVIEDLKSEIASMEKTLREINDALSENNAILEKILDAIGEIT
jgi:uncharacterized coiled-coil protein SlyX